MSQARPNMPISTYIDHPVPMIVRPPYKFEKIDAYSYLLGTKSEGKKIAEHFIDKYLNSPLGSQNGKHVYHVPTGGTRPMLTFSINRESFADLYPDLKISYLEVALQIAVIVTNPDDGTSVGNSFYLPVLFIDGVAPVSTHTGRIDSRHATSPVVVGREMYGLPKIPASIDIKASGLQLKSANVDFYGNHAISVDGADTDISESESRVFDDKQRRGFAEELFGPMEPNFDWTVGTTNDRFNARVNLVHAGLPNRLIGLRQFRNPGNFTFADARAVIEAPYEITSGSPRPMGNQVVISFSKELATGLHLEQKYVINRSDLNGIIYLKAASIFGEPGDTVVRPTPGKPDSGTSDR